MSYILSRKDKERYFSRAIAKIRENNHQYVSGTYENKNSRLIVFCPMHSTKHETTFDNYCRSKTGTNCCGKELVSNLLTNRQYSPETLKKMSEAAIARIRQKTTSQDWRRTSEGREWEKNIDKIWNNECAISGVKANLVRHHFFSNVRYETNTFPESYRYAPQNGILLQEIFHKDFHSKFGYERNNIQQFQIYLKNLKTLIRSQIQDKSWEGSETRVNDPFGKQYFKKLDLVFEKNRNEKLIDCDNLQSEALSVICPFEHLQFCLERVMKLHERLEKIRLDLPE